LKDRPIYFSSGSRRSTPVRQLADQGGGGFDFDGYYL
jgi:hypothetical protein